MYRNPEHYADPTAGQAIQKPLPFRSSSGKATAPARKPPVKTAVMSEKQIRRIEKERLDKLLLPCPFCGSPAEITTCPHNTDEVSTARCKTCGTRMGAIFGADSAQRAVEAWNRRIV